MRLDFRPVAYYFRGMDAAVIRQAREYANLSQAELADLLGVSERSVQGWESGRTPQPRHRRALSTWLDSLKEKV